MDPQSRLKRRLYIVFSVFDIFGMLCVTASTMFADPTMFPYLMCWLQLCGVLTVYLA